MRYTIRSNNMNQFVAAMKKAYATSKSNGAIPAADISIYDKLIAYPAVNHPTDADRGWVPAAQAHRQWRRRVSRMYHRTHGRLVGGPDDIDWTNILDWLIDNIIPLMKMLFLIIPFII